MIKNKSNINWAFLILGILALCGVYFMSTYVVAEASESKILTVELSKDITRIKGGRRTKDFKFRTKEYPNQFNILTSSITVGKRGPIARLKAGQKIEILIPNTSLDRLGHSDESITVQGISRNKRPLMTKSEFLANRYLYHKRRIIIFAFIGLMFLFNGLLAVPNKINYILTGLFFAALLFMKIFEFGIY